MECDSPPIDKSGAKSFTVTLFEFHYSASEPSPFLHRSKMEEAFLAR